MKECDDKKVLYVWGIVWAYHHISSKTLTQFSCHFSSLYICILTINRKSYSFTKKENITISRIM